MIRILLCCAGGFSSSTLSSKVNKEIIENNMRITRHVDYRNIKI